MSAALTMCDCGCRDRYRVGTQYMLMNNSGQDIPSALTSQEKKMLLQEEPECLWCKEPAVLVEHNHFTNHVRGTACSEDNARWRAEDAERYEGRTGPSSPPFYRFIKLRLLYHIKVSGLISELEFLQFRYMEQREEINQVRSLAIEQLADDVDESAAERYGRSGRTYRPGVLEETNAMRSMCPRRTQRELELQADIALRLESVLTIEQQRLVYQRYGTQESLQQIAQRLGITQQAVSQRFKTIHKKLVTPCQSLVKTGGTMCTR